MTAVIITLAILCLLFHHKHYRRRLTIRQSIPGPFGTYLSIGKRFRD